MCGILFTTKDLNNFDIDQVLKFLKRRGPDHTEHKLIKGYNFIHVLLSMTGINYTIQPFVYGDIVIMYNGEIYNYRDFGDFNSDGECIIECYKKYGDDFVKYLDGEFALLLVDFSKDILYYSTDIFSIKPLWFAQDDNDIGICSYESSLKSLGYKNIKQVDANTTIKMELSSCKLLNKQSVYDFDLTQYKTTFDDWNKAFENAIIKRTLGLKHKVFIGLSGGYDSGLISCVLNKLDINYTAYTILGSEDVGLINKRHHLLKRGSILDMTQKQFNSTKDFLEKNSEEYILKIENGEKENYIRCLMTDKKDKANQYLQQYKFRMTGQKVTNDNGSIGVSYICSNAKPNGEIIYLSGSGADEVISDYGFNGVKHYGHSTIGGKFPDDLSSVFPWKNFFGNTQRAYLMKEESVSGTWGVEGRYPFLDKQVVQEFLWLSVELKNINYKSPIHNYLTTHNYPFENGIKVGFGCGFTGQHDNFKKITQSNISIDRTPIGISKHGNELIVNMEEDKSIEQYIIDNNINFDILLNYNKNNQMSSQAGRYIIYINNDKTEVYKKNNYNKFGVLLKNDLKNKKKFTEYKDILQNLYKYKFIGKHTIKGYDIENDGSYKCKLIKGYELGPFIENKDIPKNILKKILKQINILQNNIYNYWENNDKMIGDWNDKNCVYSIEDDIIYNIDIEGFYNYKYEKQGKHKSTEASITWINDMLDKVTNNIYNLL
jgi:asparagine synthetase B (glutamine-hydrolysing)